MKKIQKIMMVPILAMAAWSASATEYPTKPIKLVVTMAPGGGTDLLGRAIAEPLSKMLNQPVIVENVLGAGGMLGATNVARAVPDGHTILLTVTSILQAPLIYGKAQYDPYKDFAPVTDVATTALVFAVNKKSNFKTMQEFVAASKGKPLSYGSFGAGSSGHMVGEVFREGSKLDMTHIGYKGEVPALTDLVGNQLDGAVLSVRGTLGQDKIHTLAVTGSQRDPRIPDVPTFKEAGIEGLEVLGWYGVFAPAKTPKDIVQKLSLAINQVIQREDISQRLELLALNKGGSTPEEFAKVYARDGLYYKNIIEKFNIKVQ